MSDVVVPVGQLLQGSWPVADTSPSPHTPTGCGAALGTRVGAREGLFDRTGDKLGLSVGPDGLVLGMRVGPEGAAVGD